MKQKEAILYLSTTDELILSKYVLYSLMNNNGDLSAVTYNGDHLLSYEDLTFTKNEMINFLDEVLKNYINNSKRNQITEKEKQILKGLNYDFQIKTKKESIENIINNAKQKEEQAKELVENSEQIERWLKGESKRILSSDIAFFVKYGSTEKVEQMKQFIDEKISKGKIGKYCTGISKDEIYDSTVKAFYTAYSIRETKTDKSDYNILKEELIASPTILLTLSDQDQLKVLRESNIDDFKIIYQNYYVKKLGFFGFWSYNILRFRRNFSTVLEERKEELEQIQRIEIEKKLEKMDEQKEVEVQPKVREVSQMQKELYVSIISNCKKIVNCINKNYQELPEELIPYLEQEDFSLLDYYAITKLEIPDLYRIMLNNANRKNGVITKEDTITFNKWVHSKTGLKITKNYEKIVSVYNPYVSKDEIENGKIIIKGTEITTEEKNMIAKFLHQNHIPRYNSIYRNALRKYKNGILIDRYNAFATKYNYSERKKDEFSEQISSTKGKK